MELVWVHDVGYHYKTPDGRLIPTGRKLEDIIDKADPASMAASTDGVEIIPIRDSTTGSRCSDSASGTSPTSPT